MSRLNLTLKVKSGEPAKCEGQWGYFPSIFCPSFGTIVVTGQTGEDQLPPEIAHDRAYSEQEGLTVSSESFLTRQEYPYKESWHIISGDHGMTWMDYGMPPVYTLNVLGDGTWIGFEFNTYLKRGPEDSSSYDRVTARAWKSCDNGRTWMGPLYIPFISPKVEGNTSPIGIHRSLVECPDGSLLVTVYGKFEGDEKCRTMIYRSTDKGKSFAYYSTIGGSKDDSGKEGFDEPVMELLPDGDLICLMRTGSYAPMVKSYSSDYGATWSKPEYLGQSGVDPALKVLSNGVLVCSFGRPDVSVMFSSDGRGIYWPEKILVWRNGNKKEGLVMGSDYWNYDKTGTCAYTGLAEVSPGKVMMVFSAPRDPSDPSIDNPWDKEKRKKMTIWMVTFDAEICY